MGAKGGVFKSEKSIQTILRIRPPHNGSQLRVNSNTVSVDKNACEKISFQFDKCFPANATQEDVFSEIKPLFDNIVRGVNTTVFCYGSTGAGKTHTMQGTEGAPGIVRNFAGELFREYLPTFSHLFEIRVSVTYMEIYNEKVYDLLSRPGALADKGAELCPLAVREDSRGEVVIQGLSVSEVGTEGELVALLEEGSRKRVTAKTLLNSSSSRSHSVLGFIIDMRTEERVTKAKFNFIDLAGSENNRKTGNDGLRMAESASINRSLFVLNKVVDSLARGLGRIPYRDSKLTRILQDSLGGKSACLLIVNVAGDASPETVSTLCFAGKSRKVTNKVVGESLLIERKEPRARRDSVLLRRPTRPFCSLSRGAFNKRPDASDARNMKVSAASLCARGTADLKMPNAKRAKAAEAVRPNPISGSRRAPITMVRGAAGYVAMNKENVFNARGGKTRAGRKVQGLSRGELVGILNSGDFLRVKALPCIGDKRAEMILNYTKAGRRFGSLEELERAGIPRKVVGNIVSAALACSLALPAPSAQPCWRGG